jgi:nonsense-mediated mRNA decay protein 3
MQFTEYEDGATYGDILCCLCGTHIQPNPSNMCMNCLKTQVDITEGISKQLTVLWCRTCGRYQRPPWVEAAWDSKELLQLCLKKIRGLSKEVKIIDADFVYTEPHSKRIKVRVTIQKEVFTTATLQQQFVVEYVIAGQQCLDCQRSFTEHVWTACVQLRQKIKHKRTFFFVEQMLIRHSAADKAIGIKEISGGLDFYFRSESHAKSFVHFLRSVVPIRDALHSRKLISEDLSNNTKNFKYTTYIEIVPICANDLVILPPSLARSKGGVSQLQLCYRMGTHISLIDPTSLANIEVSSKEFYKDPFQSYFTTKRLVKFDVVDIEREYSFDHQHGQHSDRKHPNARMKRFQLANITVARVSDYEQFQTTTHLGHLLNIGDVCMGYDLSVATSFDTNVSAKVRERSRAVCLCVSVCVCVRRGCIRTISPNRAKPCAWFV